MMKRRCACRRLDVEALRGGLQFDLAMVLLAQHHVVVDSEAQMVGVDF
jgi:hypothetical protein